ncbi:probable U2 snRNP component HSH155 [Zygosaccharomyces bailii ISA1307]|nr:probable U2 snRNP component HSH155 [Zygosaccharomyces bailii ISA1307]
MNGSISFVSSSEREISRLGGRHSLLQDSKSGLRVDTADDNSTNVKEITQLSNVSTREDGYHETLADETSNETSKKRVASEEGNNDILPPVKKQSRWDVRSYEIPEVSQETQKDLKEKLDIALPEKYKLKFFKPSDRKHFAQLLIEKPTEALTKSEKKERSLLSLLLKVKNGDTSSRKASLRTLRAKCYDYGPKLILDSILPILLDKTLEDQERHLMIKVIGGVLLKLGSDIRPYTHRVMTIVSPLLIDEDPIARATGREIITTLANAVGLVSIITSVSKDVDNDDDYVRNTTARAMAVVGKALGVANLIPFLNAICHSRKSWRARQTGVKIIQQIAILLGVGILPHLAGLVECLHDSLMDAHIPLRIATANALTTLAQNSHPYGIEAFNFILETLWKGLRMHRGKTLAAFLKCLGSLISLMDAEYSMYYTQEVMRIVKREFSSPDDEMKRAVMVVLQTCSKTEGVTPRYLRENVAEDFFKNFWIRRTALDLQLNKMVSYTTVVLSEKIGARYTIDKLLKPLRDESEPFRTMAVATVSKVVSLLGTAELDERQELRLIDGLLVAFQEQTTDIIAFLKDLEQHKNPTVRQHAADLCAILVPVIKNCEEVAILNKLNIVLYESLGEVFPDVLGSIIGAMFVVVTEMNLSIMQPSVNQLLPTLTPILRNRHKKVQLNSIDLVGRIAALSPESVPPKEWMRICFEMLEMLKSTNKSIRRAANDTFGLIANAIGPQDVLVTLLNNLKVQERQLRVCTAIAIGIVAKACGPYVVLPALMNEYKTPETNVQNGVLKALAFMFEYIGDMSHSYVYFVTPVIEDALTDRDLVHRQTAANVIRHISLHCSGAALEDAFIHMLNLLMPNIFETSPHVIDRILEGLEALTYTLGPGIFLNYVWAGLFHPARHVRKAYWKVYNNAYVQHLDALVPYYPIPKDNTYIIDELDIIL